MFRERGDILAALAEGRDSDSYHIEPVIEILPEFALRRQTVDIPIRGRNDARLDGNVPGAAEPPRAAFLQHPQQFHLKRQGHVADFVQEERALPRQLEEARLARVGAGKGALFMAEELAFEEFGVHAADVDRHKGLRRGSGRRVDLPRHDLLARPAFPRDEHGALRRSDARDERPHRFDGARTADQPRGPRFRPRLRFERVVALAVGHRRPYLPDQLVRVEGLDEIIVGSRLYRANGVGNLAQGGDHDDGRPYPLGHDPFQERLAAHARHAKVEDDGVEGLREKFTLAFEAVGGGRHLDAFESEELLDGIADILLIVDDEHLHGFSSFTPPWRAPSWRGSSKRARVPPPSRAASSMRPPAADAKRSQIARPMPVPLLFVV